MLGLYGRRARSHGPHSAVAADAACTAAAAGIVAATGIKGLDMHYFEHLQECRRLCRIQGIVEGVFFTYALLHVCRRPGHLATL